MEMLLGGLLAGFLLGAVVMGTVGLAEWERGYRRGRGERADRSQVARRLMTSRPRAGA